MNEYTEILADKCRAQDERERVNEATLVILNGGQVKKASYSYFPVVSMDDVITKAMEDDTINECIKQILLIVPHSKLSQLIRDKAREVAADALDIILED